MTGSPSKLIGLVALLALIAAACSSGTVEQDTAADETERVNPEAPEDEEPNATTSTTTSETADNHRPANWP